MPEKIKQIEIDVNPEEFVLNEDEIAELGEQAMTAFYEYKKPYKADEMPEFYNTENGMED